MAEVTKDFEMTAVNIRKLVSNLSATSNIEWKNIVKELQITTEVLKDELNREEMPETLYPDVLKVLRLGYANTQKEMAGNRDSYLAVTESYRTLRNACAGCPQNQQLIYRESGILTITLSLCQQLTAKKSSEGVTVLCCAVQFLGNLCVGNLLCQKRVWSLFASIFSDLVSFDDKKLPHYTCMVIHTCLSGLCQRDEDVGVVTEFLSTNENGRNLIINILNKFCDTSSEWMLYVLEDVLKLNDILKSLIPILNNQQKLLLLEIISKLLSDGHVDDSTVSVSSDNLESIAADFTSSAHSMLEINQDTGAHLTGTDEDTEARSLIIMKELEVLCAATSDPSKYQQLRADQMTLRTTISLLHSVNALGKLGENIFSSKKKVSTSEPVHDQHPVFGLKRDLIRLIGNLAYRNTANQNLVRELDGLPLILDHTSIDERNPFITQWSVFAVRNLCENNPGNQSVLAGMKMEGLADNVDMLRDFGVQAELEDDKIVVKPTSK